MSNENIQGVQHEFRISRENSNVFKEPFAEFQAPFSPLIVVRWYRSSAGGFMASSQMALGVECLAFVTRSQPYEIEFKPFAHYPDHRIFSAEECDIPLWTKQWFDELEPYFDMFMNGPKGGAA